MNKVFLDTNLIVYANDSRDAQKQARAIELVTTAMREGTGVIYSLIRIPYSQFPAPYPSFPTADSSVAGHHRSRWCSSHWHIRSAASGGSRCPFP